MRESRPEDRESITDRRDRSLKIGHLAVSAIVGLTVTGAAASAEIFPPGVSLTLGIVAAVASYMLMRHFRQKR